VRTALYAGSFDPLTVGHVWVVETAARLFDHVVVGLGGNPEKKRRYAIEDSLTAIRETFASHPNVEVVRYAGLTVRYAQQRHIPYLVRGIRNASDLLSETTLRDVNHDIAPTLIEYVYLMPPPQLASISSSMVMSVMAFAAHDVVARYVPEPVFRMMTSKFEKTHKETT
jgi:pantetheine-phosphate adenylyltransferase